MGIETNNLSRMTRFGLRSFYKGVLLGGRPLGQDDHFWVVPRVIVIYRFDCILKTFHSNCTNLSRILIPVTVLLGIGAMIFRVGTLHSSIPLRIRGSLCDNWNTSFLPCLIFNWCTFSRRVAARWWRQWAKNQVSTNQNFRNRWCQIVRRTIW